jgi:23S rRNA pseudouridine1911/1915/1917 synthase
MTERVELEARVPAELHGSRLDQVAAHLFPRYSRSRLQGWIRAGALSVDGRPCRPRDKVFGGASLRIDAELDAAVGWHAQPIALDILHEDDAILVLNKPPGLVVHPAAGHAEGTLVNAVLAHVPGVAQLPRAGIVHRLDKDTSGLLVVAKTLPAHRSLVAQLQARSVRREYSALCVGAMTGGGTVDAPIGRHPRQRKKMAVVTSGGKRAVTHYRLVQRFGHHSRIEVCLETGRTHQIRVHMAHRHHPLVGDPVYGGRPRIPAGASPELVEALRAFPRQALHARSLGLLHPESGEPVQFESPLPRDILELIAVLAREDPAGA